MNWLKYLPPLPEWLLVSVIGYVGVLLSVAVLRGQEVQFVPPKIGARPPGHQRSMPHHVQPSKQTPDPEFLTPIVNSAIETACRAVSLPDTPEGASLRVFIFRRQGDRLVCSHFWAENPSVEKVGITQFDLTGEARDDAVVVRAFLSRKTCRSPATSQPRGVHGRISDIKYVLATPILNKDASVWGVVDFDASKDPGITLLSSRISDTVMVQLARQLSIVFQSHGAM